VQELEMVEAMAQEPGPGLEKESAEVWHILT
jgi:hypothetical protein